MRITLRVASLTAVGLLTAGLSAPSATAAPRVTLPPVAELPRGATTHVPYLSDTTIHTGTGDLIELPTAPPADAADDATVTFHLLGNSPRGWVVEAGYYRENSDHVHRLMRVTGDGVVTVFLEQVIIFDEQVSQFEGYRLSDDRTRVLESQFVEEVGVTLTVFTLDGRRLDGHYVGFAGALDFSGPIAVISGNGGTMRWRIGSEPTRVTKRVAAFADLGRGTLAVMLPHGRSGFTRLATPGRVRWAAAFRPLRTSPDGRLVYGMMLTRTRLETKVVQVRQVRDGKVVAAFRMPDWPRDSRWEGSRAVLVTPTYAGRSRVIVRCTLTGRCARASAPVTPTDYGDAFAFPDAS